MDFSMAMNYIEDKNKLGNVPGLVNVKELLFRLGNPQDKCKVLHIAGTNGKGSIFAFVQEILLKEGYKVGRYISPTIFDYRERFQINKEYIHKEKFAKLLTRVSEVVEDMVLTGKYNPTAFEIETALAFLYFQEENVDYALIECGMGGELDGTNVMNNPLVTVMAAISMDHMQFLGDTLAEIAVNKAGIIKNNTICISYPQKEEVRKVLEDRCRKTNSSLFYANKDKVEIISMDLNGSTFMYKGEIYQIGLMGEYQIYNAITAIETIMRLREVKGVDLTTESLKKGLKETVWLGRMTKVSNNPLMFVDGAHNEDAWLALRDTINQHFANKYFTNRRIIYIIGVLKDKDYNRMIDILKDTMDYAITVTPDTPRGLSNEVLGELIRKRGIPVKTADNSGDAIEYAMEIADENSVIMVSGSLSFILDYLKFGENNL